MDLLESIAVLCLLLLGLITASRILDKLVENQSEKVKETAPERDPWSLTERIPKHKDTEEK